MTEDHNYNGEEVEEGVEILDPELKAKAEAAKVQQDYKVAAMRTTNAAITQMLKTLSEEHGLKLYLAGYTPEFKEMGVWKSSNVDQFDEMGLSKLMETQF